MKNQPAASVPEDIQRILSARHHDPFSFLGKHRDGDTEVVRAYVPGAVRVSIAEGDLPLERLHGTDLFEWRGRPGTVPDRYRLTWTSGGAAHTAYDPYCFAPLLSDYDLYLFGEGNHQHAYRFLGAHPHNVAGIHGTLFAVWAPNAGRVSVVGDFNTWDGRRNPMRSRGGSGIWELFIPGIAPGTLYKFELRHRDSGGIHLKSDPYGQQFELRPYTASIVADAEPYPWQDQGWIERRRGMDWLHAPVTIFEVHLGSWRRGPRGTFLSYRELAQSLVPYVLEMGFTHIELLPITEHPFDASWGYQTTGYYAPTSRYGTPEDFRYFVDHCHRHGIGVILDWAPGHFPKDAHGLARFDGSALYEHEDPRRGEHRDWGTLIFNYGRNEVRNFLVSSALYWLEEFHIDGLRVDAVASMLYLDYSREPGDWTPNVHGGNENLEAIDFLRRLNQLTHELHPGTLMLAEESTAWPMVSRPTWLGGLGFSMKWNMGWMNDTLSYMSKDPVYRKYQHDMLTFSQLYAFTENFVLPFSHDEVVHGKQSLLNKMPGDEWQRFANLRLLYVYMYTHPGKKLLFMGCEFGQGREWDDSVELDWYVLDYAYHQGMQKLVRDLNRLYRESEALHQFDFEGRGFDWIDCHDSSQSVLTYLRQGERDALIVALNFTPVLRRDYRIGVPHPGVYREILNSDSEFYAGSNQGNGSGLHAEAIPWMGRPYSIAITLPPLAGVVLRPEAG
ncbi:MAG: 1,4-alpha-glucan branching protein GlgB [Gammaproteobacteria bacterium]|nr:1,4-alpha-glucan branching protein GlgB [Gammaproteobacteria bacterium]